MIIYVRQTHGNMAVFQLDQDAAVVFFWGGSKVFVRYSVNPAASTSKDDSISMEWLFCIEWRYI